MHPQRPTVPPSGEPQYETTPRWEILLEAWRVTGKISQEDCDLMQNEVANEIWQREREGYTWGRAYHGRQQHGG